MPGDLLVDSYIEELVQKTATFGGGKIHVLVNNAGFTWDGVIHKVALMCLSPRILSRQPVDNSFWIYVHCKSHVEQGHVSGQSADCTAFEAGLVSC